MVTPVANCDSASRKWRVSDAEDEDIADDGREEEIDIDDPGNFIHYAQNGACLAVHMMTMTGFRKIS
ncbi:hypothetical protein GCM10011430_13350 [Oxalicibacterium solurbis]|uniref:Uncharacterized protein n=1 Tax=Oxalicibacterium solurbis TaxID=69280 RepID=A0A8J3AXW5_9BURK|nr:hypothetical protein GCM10011430_13350 [Oxalicibacterium solurbis]